MGKVEINSRYKAGKDRVIHTPENDFQSYVRKVNNFIKFF